MPSFPSKSGGGKPPVQPVRIRSVAVNEVLAVRFLGPIHGLITHQHAGRSTPCLGLGDCPSTVHKQRMVFKAYGPAEIWDRNNDHWQPVVMEVTENLEEILRGRTLRGEVWLLARDGPGKPNDPVTGVYIEQAEATGLRPGFDVKPVLCRVFHCPDLKLGATNPMPPRLYLEPVHEPGPVLPEEFRPGGPRERTAKEEQVITRKLADMFKENGDRPKHLNGDRNGSTGERGT